MYSPEVVLRRAGALIESDDPLRVRRGLQLLCALFEKSALVGEQVRQKAQQLASRVMTSEDSRVRRWLYKLIGLIGDSTYKPFLMRRLEKTEEDPENQAWLVAALCAIEDLVIARGQIYRTDINASDSTVELATQYFGSAPSVWGKERLRSEMGRGDPLTLKWMSLRHGSREQGFQLESSSALDIIGELTGHEDPGVAEYATWSLASNSAGQFKYSRIAPEALFDHPANVRRWFYRLMTKDSSGFDTNLDFFREAPKREKDAAAREGLAQGLNGLDWSPELDKIMLEWWEHERNFLVRMQLLLFFSKSQEHNPAYTAILVENASSPGFRGYDLLDVQSQLELPFGDGGTARSLLLSPRQGGAEMGIPLWTSTTSKNLYLIASDTVGFSQESDDHQVAIFKDLLRTFAGAEDLRHINPDLVVCLLTGDGLIIGFEGVDLNLVPVRLALAAQERWRMSAKELRIGLHQGGATLFHMSDGTRQLVGHAVNWVTRVMGAADPGEILASSIYSESTLGPERSKLGGIETKRKKDLATKFGEDIEAFKVSYAGTGGEK